MAHSSNLWSHLRLIVSMHGFVQFYVNEYKTEKMEIKIH